MTLEEAGTDEDLRQMRIAHAIDSRLERGRALIAEARQLHETPSASDRAEHVAREALDAIASALNWAEDTAREGSVHAELDAAGKWTRTTFGCLVHQEGRQYFVTCPVRLAHTRVGFSIGGHAKRLCSLCGEDLSECAHERGTAYLVHGGITDLDWCRVCLQRRPCEHSPDQLYRVSVVAVVTELELDEVSLVDKPANPDARIQKMSLDTSELQDLLGPDWSPGVPVNCDFCLSTCDGLRRIRHPDL